jgi:hypothetical protein
MRDPVKHRRNFTPAMLIVSGLLLIVLILTLVPILHSIRENAGLEHRLHCAKGIALTCRLYASDQNGLYPYYTDPVKRTGAAKDANQAFEILIPAYIPIEKLFYVKGSAWSDHIPDEKPPLAPGENHWAYFGGLTDTSNPAYPLIAEGFVEGSEADPIYVFDSAKKGGLKGKRPIVVRSDMSGNIERVTPRGFVGRHGASEKNLFRPVKGEWMDGAVVLNPR